MKYSARHLRAYRLRGRLASDLPPTTTHLSGRRLANSSSR
jgi:hypothetical protein